MHLLLQMLKEPDAIKNRYMKKIVIIFIVSILAACKTVKNDIVLQEKYEVVNSILDKYKNDYALYYKTTPSLKIYWEDGKLNNWGVYVNFDRFSYNYDVKGLLNKIDFQKYLTKEDLVFIREQINTLQAKRWMKNKIAFAISKNRDAKVIILSEPVFSKDHTTALILRLQGEGTDIVICRKEEGKWLFFGVVPVMLT